MVGAGEDEKTAASAHFAANVLAPVRTIFQPFLTDQDAGRLMRVGASFTAAVLSGFRITRHMFCAESADHLWRLAVYERYGILISCLMLDASFDYSLVDGNGWPRLPSSLIALALGYVEDGEESMFEGVVKEFFDHGFITSKDSEEQIVQRLHRLLEARIDALRDVEPDEEDASTRLVYSPAYGLYNRSLPPGALPVGLRFLLCNDRFDRTLLPRSIPPTVVYVAFSDAYERPLTQQLFPPSVKVVGLQWMDGMHVDEHRYGCSSWNKVTARLPEVHVVADCHSLYDLNSGSSYKICDEEGRLDEVGYCDEHGYQRYRWLRYRRLLPMMRWMGD